MMLFFSGVKNNQKVTEILSCPSVFSVNFPSQFLITLPISQNPHRKHRKSRRTKSLRPEGKCVCYF